LLFARSEPYRHWSVSLSARPLHNRDVGADLVWLGVLSVLAVEIGLLTPPFGIAVFVIKSTLGPDSAVTLGQIFRGATPFAIIMFAVLLLIFMFPWLATALI